MSSLLGGLDLLIIIILVLLPWVLLFYIYNDAENRYGSGCMWVIIIILFGWLGIIAYFVMRYFFERPTTARRLGEQFPVDTSHMGRLGRGVMGRTGGTGAREQKTVFGKESPTAPEFRDYRAEELIDEGKYDEAEKYLREMAEIAKREGDAKRVTTYRYYYNRIVEFRKDTSGGSRK